MSQTFKITANVDGLFGTSAATVDVTLNDDGSLSGEHSGVKVTVPSEQVDVLRQTLAETPSP